jgi:hypothetical protein
LNPRLPRCERGDHTRLIYRPDYFWNKTTSQEIKRFGLIKGTGIFGEGLCKCVCRPVLTRAILQ